MTKRNGETVSNSFTTISANTKITGEVHSDSDIRIDGTVEGNIDSKAKIVLGSGGKVIGDLICQNADISCEVIGNIYTENQLKLNNTANIKGDIFTKKLLIESGAIFIGRCEMGQNKGVKELLAERNFKIIPEETSEEKK